MCEDGWTLLRPVGCRRRQRTLRNVAQEDPRLRTCPRAGPDEQRSPGPRLGAGDRGEEPLVLHRGGPGGPRPQEGRRTRVAAPGPARGAAGSCRGEEGPSAAPGPRGRLGARVRAGPPACDQPGDRCTGSARGHWCPSSGASGGARAARRPAARLDGPGCGSRRGSARGHPPAATPPACARRPAARLDGPGCGSRRGPARGHPPAATPPACARRSAATPPAATSPACARRPAARLDGPGRGSRRGSARGHPPAATPPASVVDRPTPGAAPGLAAAGVTPWVCAAPFAGGRPAPGAPTPEPLGQAGATSAGQAAARAERPPHPAPARIGRTPTVTPRRWAPRLPSAYRWAPRRSRGRWAPERRWRLPVTRRRLRAGHRPEWPSRRARWPRRTAPAPAESPTATAQPRGARADAAHHVHPVDRAGP